MTTLYFVRHGQSIGNKNGRFLGYTDQDLSELGYRQAEMTSHFFDDIHIDAVYSSDLIRAFHTVEPIAKLKHLNVIPDRNLREIYCGTWENQPFDELKSSNADYQKWLVDIGHAVCTEGESVAHLQQRINDEVNKIVRENKNKTVVIGTHATPIRAMTCIWRNLDIGQMNSFGWVDNASVTKVNYDENGKGTIELYNYSEQLGKLCTRLGANV